MTKSPISSTLENKEVHSYIAHSKNYQYQWNLFVRISASFKYQVMIPAVRHHPRRRSEDGTKITC